MAQVTIQSGGYVTVPGSVTDVVALQNQIAAVLNPAAAAAGANFYTATLSGGSATPNPPGTATVTEAYISDGSGAYAYNVGSAYQYVVVDQSGAAQDSITLAPGQDVVSGTIGSAFFGGGNDTVALGGGNNVYQSSGISAFLQSDYVVAGAGNDTLSEANGGTLDGGAGTNLLIAESTAGSVTFISSGIQDTVEAGATQNVVTLTAAAQGGVVFGGLDTFLTVNDLGTGDSIAGITAIGITATMAGSSGLLFGGAALNVSVLDTGTGDTISGQNAANMNVTLAGSGGVVATGASSATVSASGSAAGRIIGGTGSLVFLGGAGTSTVRGGTGTNSIVGGSGGLVVAAIVGTTSVTGGSGVVTLFGGAGSDVTYNSHTTGLLYLAGTGNETLDASGSAGNDSLFGGAVSGANILMKAGSGNDTLAVGAGNNTMVGGSGQDLFAFFSGNGGGQDSLGNLTSADTIALIGYSLTDASNMLALSNSSNSPAPVSYKLSDGTQISFLAASGVHII